MYIIKGREGDVLEISKDLDYQENGNLLVHGGTLAIAKSLVQDIEETDIIPSNWKLNESNIYQRNDLNYSIPDKFKKPNELRQEGADTAILELIKKGIL